MKKAILLNIGLLRNKEIFLHSFVGLLIGYFVLHPFSMAINWFEITNSVFNWDDVLKVISESLSHSFSLHMMPMSVAYSVFGILAGLGSGLYFSSIKKKKQLLYGKGQMLNQSIPGLIASGENEFVEFKSSLRHDYRQVKTDKNLENVVLKEIAGFLNADGGIIIVGVDDQGTVLGLENDFLSLKKKNRDGFQQRIMLLIANAFGKNVCSKVHLSFHLINQSDVCVMYIEPSQKPVYLPEGNRTVFYLRTGNLTNPLTTRETVEYLNSKE